MLGAGGLVVYSIQRIDCIMTGYHYLLIRGPKAAGARSVVWRGTNAHQAFLQLYKTMAANQ